MVASGTTPQSAASTTRKTLVSLLLLGATAAIVIGGATAGVPPDRRPSMHRPVVATSVGGPVFSLADAAPGSVTTRSVVVSNTGTAPGRFSFVAASRCALAEAVRVRVSVVRGSTLATEYEGRLSRLRSVPLGTLEPGERVVVRFRVALASTGSETADQALAGRHASAALAWTATQA